MATLTVYPTIDTVISRDSVNQTFTNIRSGAGTVTEDAATQTAPAQLASTSTSNQYGTLSRGAFNFDLPGAGLPSNATITAITFSLYVVSKLDQFTSSLQSVGVVDFTPASDSSYATSDYSNFGTTRYATDLTIAGITTSAYNAWTLNATGIAAAQAKVASGRFHIGTRLSCDIDNSAPTWISLKNARIVTGMVDNATQSQRPTIDITYNVSNNLLLLGVG